LATPHRPEHSPPGAAAEKFRRQIKLLADRQVTEKKILLGQEPPRNTDVDCQTPGEAPQPLTLNHPVSNPGRISGRGSFMFDRLYGYRSALLGIFHSARFDAAVWNPPADVPFTAGWRLILGTCAWRRWGRVREPVLRDGTRPYFSIRI
jgi:hypothetical protein